MKGRERDEERKEEGGKERDEERNSKRVTGKQSVSLRGRERAERGRTAMQTPFGVSRRARSPAMRVVAVCLDLLPQTRLPFITKTP